MRRVPWVESATPGDPMRKSLCAVSLAREVCLSDLQQPQGDHECANIVKMLQELHLPAVAVLHDERGRFVEEVPC